MPFIRPKVARFLFVRGIPFAAWVLLLPFAAVANSVAALGNPEAPAAGKVAGIPMHAVTGAELRDIAMQELLDRFAREKRVPVSSEEISAYREFMKRAAEKDRDEKSAYREELRTKLSSGNLDAAGREKTMAELREIEQLLTVTAPKDSFTEEEVSAMNEMAEAVIRQWKVNGLLQKEYGGRIILQQGGPEPLDAYRRFLESAQQRGDLTIAGETLELQFWQYFRDDSLHDFYPSGSPEEAQAFHTPPWALEQPANLK